MRSNAHRAGASMLFAGLLVIGIAAGLNCEDASKLDGMSSSAPRERLTIITPHNKKIRDAFTVEFSNWYESKNGRPVDIEWIVRGTRSCLDYVDQVFQAQQRADTGPRVIPDLMFGGGVADHQVLADRDQSKPIQIGDRLKDIPPMVADLPTHDPNGHWFAIGLSSFGIVYNAKACDARGVQPPATWSDLADPRFYGWIGVADPKVSGSNLHCMMLMLQRYGWEEGWSVIMRLLGNARALSGGSSDVLSQVRSGVFLAAVAVNFDGMNLQEETGGTVRYVNPLSDTALSPDAASVLKCTNQPEIAKAFIEFALSEPGQVLFGVRANARRSFGDTLYHYPIDPAVYEKYADGLALAENPIQMNFGFSIDNERAGRQFQILVPLVQAACENHVLLQNAWKKVIDAGLPEDAVHELTSPLFDEETAYQQAAAYADAEPAEAERMMREWAEAFRAKYLKTISLVSN